MGFNSLDDLMLKLTAGQTTGAVTWNKVTGTAAYAVGRWYDLSGLNGTPVANSFAGTALDFVPCSGATGNGTDLFGLPLGGAVTPATKHILNAMAVTSVSTGVPAVLMLCDMQGYYPGINMATNAVQTLTGTPALRYPNGAGVRMFLTVRATLSSTAHTFSYSYTNQAGTAERVNPVTVANTTSAIVPHIVHSGTASNNYGPFLPLANGDSGIQSVQTVKLSAAASGTTALVLTRPLLTLPLTIACIATERDLLNQVPSLPQIQDDACLHWLLFTGGACAANTNFYGTLEAVWG